MRFGPVVLAGVALLVSACGSGGGTHHRHHLGGTPSQHSSSPSPSPSASASATPPNSNAACAGDHLAGVFDGSQGQAGQELATFVFADVGSQPCRLGGTPKVELDASGGVSIVLHPIGYQGPAAASGTVALQPRAAPQRGAPATAGEAELFLTWLSAPGGSASCPGEHLEAVRALVSVGGSSVAVPITSGGPREQLAPCEGAVGVGPWQPAQ